VQILSLDISEGPKGVGNCGSASFTLNKFQVYFDGSKFGSCFQIP
jgi:hypothetical protein